jgi:hypothetical protein
MPSEINYRKYSTDQKYMNRKQILKYAWTEKFFDEDNFHSIPFQTEFTAQNESFEIIHPIHLKIYMVKEDIQTEVQIIFNLWY